MFEEFDIATTWAVVGFVFAKLKFVHDPDVALRHLAGADVYVLPSQHEGFALY